MLHSKYIKGFQKRYKCEVGLWFLWNLLKRGLRLRNTFKIICIERMLKSMKYKERRKEHPGVLHTIATFRSLAEEEEKQKI